MAIELASRVLAVVTAVAFTIVLTTGRLPIIPKGRWTVVALFALGLGMCTVAGTRDGLGTSLAPPGWLSATLAALGISAFVVLLAVLLGLDWRAGVAGLGLLIGSSWALVLGYAVVAGLETAPLGLATLVVAAGAAFAVWRLPHGHLSSPMQPSN
ncbi:MAG TPA: hypothetical protein VL687_05905 [Methylomirabilota bacterium]|nr:hypothetical protein [Methylomirabilota bacterium]